MGVRARLGALVSKVIPGLDERAFNRERDRLTASLASEADYWRRFTDLDDSGHSAPVVTARPHVVIVPMEGPSHPTWKRAGGNFFYEISQSAREYLGEDAQVTVFEVQSGELMADWHERLIRFVLESGATHLMAQIESDPNPPAESTWELLWTQLAHRWHGIFLGVMFDSGFPMIRFGARRLARISDRFVAVDICVPMDGALVRGRPEVGPVSMPISNESFAEIDRSLGTVEQAHDVSFIGALYPYRVEMIEALRAQGVSVAVNPHRSDITDDFLSSRTNQPTYLDYMRGLAQSRMTINFAMASSLTGFQLKTRILEATGVGTLVLTDDVDRSSRFWKPGEGIAYFRSVADLPRLVTGYLEDPARLAAEQAAGRLRARSINVSSFWGGIDDGLARRGLLRLHSSSSGP